mgnify:CR=1 FL=1
MKFQVEQHRDSGRWVVIEQFDDRNDAERAAGNLARYSKLKTRVCKLVEIGVYYAGGTKK